MELANAGYFSKTHGIKGHLVLKQGSTYLSEEATVVFVDMNGGRAPYFISDRKMAGQNLIIGLEDIDTVEKARTLTGKAVYAEQRFLAIEEAEHAWLGFNLVDRRHGLLGKVEEVSDNGQQLIATLKYKGRELMLPLVEAFVERIDEEGGVIHYNAPDGLIDLYL